MGRSHKHGRQAMFDIVDALREWRKTARGCGLSVAEIDELEDHLYSAYVAHRERGECASDAFVAALRTLGAMEHVSSEYRKVRSDKWRGLLEAGWVVFIFSFFLPVVDGGITLFDGNVREGLLPGFQAIRLALEEGSWYAVSALTNALMLATMWRVTELPRTCVALLAGAMCGSTLLNGWWLLAMNGTSELRAGYFLWLVGFGLASVALWARVRSLAWKTSASVVVS